MANKKILLGITGGVAAYKSAILASQLVQNDYDVQAILTSSAAKFIGDSTLVALTGKPVVTELFDPRFPLGPHIELAREYDMLCVAPATANIMGKFANGLADDVLTTLYLCFTGPVLLAPAMNCEMWEAASVARNVAMLEKDGVNLVGPNDGWLSCRIKGKGRMAEPNEIFDGIYKLTAS